MRAYPAAALAALILLTGSPLAAAPRKKQRLRLRVVSWNVWGIPWGLSKQRAERIAAIGPALAQLKPDVVALQEVWVTEDGEALSSVLAAAGLTHSVHESEGLLGSGLLIASRYPLERHTFVPYEQVGKLHKPYHGDAWARKGFLEVQVRTPMGVVRLFDTHLHAGYGSKEYLHVQTAQALQLSSAVGDLGARPPPQRDDPARPPLLLLGDLNATLTSLPFQLLRARCDLTPASETLDIDWVLLRDGGGARWRVRKVTQALTEDVDLPGGARALSDHPAIVADLELIRGGPLKWAPKTVALTWKAAASKAYPWIEAQRDAAGLRSSRWTRRAIILTLLGSLLMFAAHKLRKKKASCLIALGSMLFLHLAVWAMYLGVIHERVEEAGLSAALHRARDGAPPAPAAETE
jgi:endonuclease/exonuclease/phosphatase family metal-dependent hydrolase